MTMPSLFDPQPQSSFTPERFQEFCEAADALNRQDRELQAHIDAFMARLQVTDAHRAEAEQTSVYRSGVAPFGGPAVGGVTGRAWRAATASGATSRGPPWRAPAPPAAARCGSSSTASPAPDRGPSPR